MGEVIPTKFSNLKKKRKKSRAALENLQWEKLYLLEILIRQWYECKMPASTHTHVWAWKKKRKKIRIKPIEKHQTMFSIMPSWGLIMFLICLIFHYEHRFHFTQDNRKRRRKRTFIDGHQQTGLPAVKCQ